MGGIGTRPWDELDIAKTIARGTYLQRLRNQCPPQTGAGVLGFVVYERLRAGWEQIEAVYWCGVGRRFTSVQPKSAMLSAVFPFTPVATDDVLAACDRLGGIAPRALAAAIWDHVIEWDLLPPGVRRAIVRDEGWPDDAMIRLLCEEAASDLARAYRSHAAEASRAFGVLNEHYQYLITAAIARYVDMGMSAETLAAHGQRGLTKAIEHVQPWVGITFESHAKGRIRKEVAQALLAQGTSGPRTDDDPSATAIEAARAKAVDDDDDDLSSPSDAALLPQFGEHLERVLRVLSNRQAQVLRMAFGIGTDRAMSNSEIAEVLGLSRTTVKIHFSEALKILMRHVHGPEDPDDLAGAPVPRRPILPIDHENRALELPRTRIDVDDPDNLGHAV